MLLENALDFRIERGQQGLCTFTHLVANTLANRNEGLTSVHPRQHSVQRRQLARNLFADEVPSGSGTLSRGHSIDPEQMGAKELRRASN